MNEYKQRIKKKCEFPRCNTFFERTTGASRQFCDEHKNNSTHNSYHYIRKEQAEYEKKISELL